MNVKLTLPLSSSDCSWFYFLKSISSYVLSATWWVFCLALVIFYGVSLRQMMARERHTAMQHLRLEKLIQDEAVAFAVVHNMATWHMIKVPYIVRKGPCRSDIRT